MATRAFPWTITASDATARTDAATAETDAQTGITNAATALVEGKKKTLYFTASLASLTIAGTKVLGALPFAITGIVGGKIRVTTAGVGAQSMVFDIVKANGTTTLLTATIAVADNSSAVDTVYTIGAGAISDSAGNLIRLRAMTFSDAITSGPVVEVEIEVTK